jgi:hypothetical protein
LHNEEENGGSA